MGDFYQNFGNAIAEGMNRIGDRKERKRNLEEEYAQRMKLLQEQARLDDASLTPEQKLMRMFQGDPQSFTQFRQALDPMAQQEFGLKQSQLGLQQQGLDLDRQKAQWQMNQGMMPPNRIQEIQWWQSQINPKTGQPYTLAEIQGFLYRPNIFSLFPNTENEGNQGGGGLPIGR